MAEENLGLDLASQTGQEDIKNAIDGLRTEGLANQEGQEAISSAVGLVASQLATALHGIVLKTTNASIGTLMATENGTYNANDDVDYDAYEEVVVSVPNSYETTDEGKVVSNGSLVSQSSQNISANGTYDTTEKSEVVVSVPNSYETTDEGKVVSSGELVAQTSRNVTENGTYDTTENNEVVVNVENSGGGTSEGGYIQRKLLDFDFTKSLTDTVRDYTPETANVTQDSQGAHFNSTSAYLKLPKNVSINEITLEIDVVEMNITSGTHRRFIIGNGNDSGLIYRSNGKWAFYSNSWVETQETDPYFFDGKTVKVHIDNQGNWKIYVNDNLWFEPTISLNLNNTDTSKYLIIGSRDGQTIYNAIISGLRIYHDIYADLAPKTITQNGTYNPADDNADGYSQVVVNVNGGTGDVVINENEIKSESGGSFSFSKSTTITKNGQYKITAFSYANNLNVTINGVTQSLDLEAATNYVRAYSKTITLNAGDIVAVSSSGTGKCLASVVVVDLDGNNSSDNNVLYNPTFNINTTGQTSWDATNSGTSSSSRTHTVDAWDIMQATAEDVSGGIKIVPKKSYAYLTQQIPYWFASKSVKLTAVVNDTEYTVTGMCPSSGAGVSLNTPFGQLYIYAYAYSDIVFTLSFENQVDSIFVVKETSLQIAA